MIRILIVDDHDLVREGIRTMLEQEPGLQVVGEVGDGQQAVRAVRELRPDVVLMDLNLPGGLGGLEATEAILGDFPQTKVIVLTQYENREYIKRALRIGARGYLLKSSASRQLKEAIHAVHQGLRYLHPLVADELVDIVSHGGSLESASDLEKLTRRERQVFKLLAEGATSRDIGRYLGVSLKTAVTHRTNLMAKLNVHSRAELIKLALRWEVITVEQPAAV
jgi:DNA-binding NarL/FixJ family response regulator